MSAVASTRKARAAKKEIIDRDKALLITSSVPVEKAFHFFNDIRKPTGMFATSIFEFVDQLKTVDLNSIEFHLRRNDFAKWLREVLRDEWLANEFERLQNAKVSDDRLRKQVVEVTERRCRQLAEALKSLGH